MTGRRFHLMGVGGVGMCALAEVLVGRGEVVSGCDLQRSERTRRLAAAGVTVMLGHDAGHVRDLDALVVSSAIPVDHPEVAAARARGVPLARRSELLAEIVRGGVGVAVAGTHGKTTTSALIAHLLLATGSDPTVLVGGRMRGVDAYGRAGDGAVVVCEADEFDRSFLELTATIAVVTNVEPEHLECYGSADNLAAAFATFANRVAVLGAVLLCVDDPGAAGLRPTLRRRVIGYGLSEAAELQAADLAAAATGTSFTVRRSGVELGRVRMPLPGEHNVRNALAAIGAGLELGLAFADLAAACASFAGVGRRLEQLGEACGVTVLDDYAHHPTELRAALAGARQALPGRRLVAVFQPHLFSRTAAFADAFGQALLAADVALVLPVYGAREAPIDGVDSELVVAAARRHGHQAVSLGPAPPACREVLGKLLRAGDVLLTLGAGDVHEVAEQWLEVAP